MAGKYISLAFCSQVRFRKFCKWVATSHRFYGIRTIQSLLRPSTTAARKIIYRHVRRLKTSLTYDNNYFKTNSQRRKTKTAFLDRVKCYPFVKEYRRRTIIYKWVQKRRGLQRFCDIHHYRCVKLYEWYLIFKLYHETAFPWYGDYIFDFVKP